MSGGGWRPWYNPIELVNPKELRINQISTRVNNN